ncbi:MAG: futalosine hydrolase [Thermoanaerobaculia bacterium]|nr:futalosine hydrolase [Thermoanaerobaculia bacterium]
MADIAIVVATELEAAGLAASGTVGGASFLRVCTGVGPVNAAIALTRLLATEEVGCVVSLGVGGAYPGSGLEPGEAVAAESECYGDLGAASPEGFLDMEALGFPVVGGHYNTLPLDRFPCARRAPFVTRSTCTGSDAEARQIVARTGGAVESMEGAAVVHTAIAHGLPVGEVRGISNRVGNRDRSAWRLEEAAAAARRALTAWIEETAC